MWWLMVAVVFLFATFGCRRGVPVIDTGPRPVGTTGTISGTVSGPEGTTAIVGRVVQVVNLETNERQRVTTNNAGGFTVKVTPGKYRLELTLKDGEALVKEPGIRNVSAGDLDVDADFVVGSGPGGGVSGRASPPRGPAFRIDPGLGAPTA